MKMKMKMKLNKLVNLINEFVYNKNLSDKEKKSLASSIKKQYNIEINALKAKDVEIPFSILKKLINPLLEDYASIKQYNSINEVMQTISGDMEISYISSEQPNSIEKEIEKIHTVILGNPGTTVKGMSSDYISKIIRRKLTESNGINSNDIINVLDMQSENMYMDIEGYQKLINDSVIAYLVSNQDGERVSNSKILKIFEGLAASYKVQGDFDKVKEIYEQALKIKSLNKTNEYQELKEHYDDFVEFLEMKKNFKNSKYSSFENLKNHLKVTYSNNQIFAEVDRKSKLPSNPDVVPYDDDIKPPKPPRVDNYIMPTTERLKSFAYLEEKLKKINDKYEICECEIGTDRYEGYVILKIEGTNVSIFENFNEVNGRCFIVKNEEIDKVKKLTKSDAAATEGVEVVNHSQDFDAYCARLLKKTKQVIKETQVGSIFDKEDDLLEDFMEDITFKFSEDEGITSIEDFKYNDEQIMEEKTDKVLKENGEQTNNIEVERKKALENRKRVQELKKQLEEIQRKTKDKIQNIDEYPKK